ncbi:hypothetical protein BGZ46_009636 [Entomortierella lignicola]|nr:hypothetical protein BGZ46_009636 [Entomortierella lignicola]
MEGGNHSFQDIQGSDQRQPYSPHSNQGSLYNRTQPLTSGSVSVASSARSSEVFDNKAASPNEYASNLTANLSSGLQRSNSKLGYSSPLSRAQSRSGSSSPSSPSNSPLKRQTSILKNGSKDAPYLSGMKNFHGVGNLETISNARESVSPNPTLSKSTSSPIAGSLNHFGSASNLRAMATVSTATTASSAPSSVMRSQELSESAIASPGEGPNSQGATSRVDGAQSAQSSRMELKDTEVSHVPTRDSANYKRSASRRRPAPPIQVQPGQLSQNPQTPNSLLSPQSVASPISPGRRYPFQRLEAPGELVAKEHGQGQGQGQHEDGDYEDEGVNDDTDGDGLSGPEDQAERRRRHQRQRSEADNASFTPARSAPLPPNSREAEMAHIKYIQQQQALFLQEKAMNQPLKTKGSNGNMSGALSDGSKPRRKASHRKQIAVISEPKLVSSTNHIKTVPIVRPADQSDNEDAGAKSEYTSGGEGIKNTVRKMRRAVRHAANGVFHDDDSDREEAVGSKSDAEKKGGLKQLRALKSKLAKKLNRPGHGGSSSARQGDAAGNGEEQGSRAPVQFFSEDNLRARYLAQEQEGGNSFAALGASLRRSNTTRDNTAGSTPMFDRRNHADGDKEEYYSADEEKEGQQGDPSKNPNETEEEAEAKAKKAKFTSRTFDKDEMIEVKDGTGESFFLPRWDLDPRADELSSTRSVISVHSSRKLERSASSATTNSNKPIASIAERVQVTTVIEEDDISDKKDNLGADSITPTPTQESITKPDAEVGQTANAEGPHPTVEITDDASETNNATSVSSSEVNSRASVLSETSNVSSVGGVVVAQFLTRQSSMKRSFTRPTMDGHNEEDNTSELIKSTNVSSQQEDLASQLPKSEITQESSKDLDEKQLPLLPQEATASETKSIGSLPVRPLSPIRRGTANSVRSPSIASVSSVMSGPSTPPTSTGNSVSPLDSQIKKNGLRNLSASSFTLPQAPSSPLPSPSLPTSAAPPTASFPGVLLRQGSNLAERASLRSMYADSIYDYYDYDSASEYGSQVGDQRRFSRQGSISSSLVPDQDGDTLNMLPTVIEKASGSETKVESSNISTAAATMEKAGNETLVVSLNGEPKRAVTAEESLATPTAATATITAADIIIPGIEEPMPAVKPREYKGEEHHVHYEDIPEAVAYRMSMMTTVPVDPVGVSAPLSMPSRPPRHPMRRSRQGSINTLTSDFTSDSWASSSVRNTRDDLSGWDVNSEQGSELARRPSTASTLSRFSNGGRSERTASIMTNSRIEEERDLRIENTSGEKGSEASSVQNTLDVNSQISHSQWYSSSRRETWTSAQSSSDSASSSSSRSSHFYFNGQSPSPSPTEESAQAAGTF